MQVSFSRILALVAFALAAVGVAPAQSDADDDVFSNPSAELLLAEGVYADEFLRDPTRAAEAFERVLAAESARPEQRRTAQWRLARCYRRLGRRDDARRLFEEVRADAATPGRLRALIERELELCTHVQAAALAPQNTVLYVEAPKPGVVFDSVLDLLEQALLDEAVMDAVFGPLRDALPFAPRGLRTELARADLSRLESLCMAWANLRFVTVGDLVDARGDMLLVLDVGGSSVIQGLLALGLGDLFPSRVQLTENLSYNVSSDFAAIDGPCYHVSHGLFVMAANAETLLDVLQRREHEATGPSLADVSAFTERPEGWPRDDEVFVYFDVVGFTQRLIDDEPPLRRPLTELGVDILSLLRVGPLFLSAKAADDRLRVEGVLNVAEGDGANVLARALRTPPLEDDWARMLPRDAWAVAVGSVDRGGERWRLFETLYAKTERFDRMSRGLRPSTNDAAALDFFREFERASGLRLTDVCDDVTGAAAVVLPPDPNDPQLYLPWAIIFKTRNAAAWTRRLEKGAGAWLGGDAADLPVQTLRTEFGDIRVFAPGGRALGPAWCVQGDYVATSLSADMLVEYLRRIADPANVYAPSAWTPETHKFIAVRLSNFINYYVGDAAGALHAPVGLPPMTIQTYETVDRVRFVAEQQGAAVFLRSLAPLAASESMVGPGLSY